MSDKIKVGVGVLVFKDDKILLKRRKGAHAAGEYEDAGGGHLEYLESFEECARREIREEVGIEIRDVCFLCVSNIKQYDPDHYVDVGFVAKWKSGEPTIMEPDRCDEIGWYDIDDLPEPISEWTRNYLEAYKTQKNCFDY